MVFYLGTGCAAHPWQNPLVSGKVHVACSGRLGRPWVGVNEVVVYHTLTNQVLFTHNEPESWVLVDLKTVRVCPTGYSFAHRSDMPKFFARNWEFQGSNDGQLWDTVYQHVNDQTVNERCLHGSWAVQSQSYYRIFRVFMGGNGNDRGTNTLVVTCFDIYGTMAPL